MARNYLVTPLILSAALLLTGAALSQPGLVWSTYFGGNGRDGPAALSLAANGDVVIGGRTSTPNPPNLPMTPGAYQSAYNGAGPLNYGDGFLACFSADGRSLLWSTYLGGTSDDMILDIALEQSSVVTVCGWTDSNNFPTTANAFQTAPLGGVDGFVARFICDSQQRLHLLWSTRLGGSGEDCAQALAIHPDGRVVVLGFTDSPNFPMAGNPFQPRLAGGYDGFLAVLDGDGRILVASTYLGGTGNDCLDPLAQQFGNHLNLGSSLALDSAGHPVVSNFTFSSDFPTTPGAFQPSLQGGVDAFVARLDIGLTRLTYATYLGGAGDDYVFLGLALGPDDRITVAGGTDSPQFPVTVNAYDTTYNGTTTGIQPAGDFFVTTLDTRLGGPQSLIWSTFLGGNGCDVAPVVAVDRCGLVTVAGAHNSTNLPATPGALQARNAGNWDVFLARLDPNRNNLNQLIYGTYLGSREMDSVWGIAEDGTGCLVICGHTNSSAFPVTPGAYDTSHNGGYDAFIAKLTLLPQGAERYGRSTPGCLWPIWQGVSSWPRSGNGSFALLASGAPPSAAAFLLLGQRDTLGRAWSNLHLYLQPTALFGVPIQIGPAGCACLPLPIPTGVPQGIRVAAQWVSLTNALCPGTGLLASSEGLELTIQ